MSGYFFKIFYILLLLLFKNTRIDSVESKCIHKEKQALLKFKQSIAFDSHMLSTWKDGEKDGDCCKWRGIECNNETGHVKKLDLRGKTFQFIISQVNFNPLFALQNMEYLDLSNNYFFGSHISEQIGSLTKLRYLNISNSAVGGRIPYQIGNLLELEYLDLSFNYYTLNGEIPSQLGNLACLRYLNLSYNDITGEIPWQLKNLSELRYLDLERTSLYGAIPFHVGNVPFLQILKLEGDFDFTPNASKWLSTLSSLTSLVLRGQFHYFGSSNHLLHTIKNIIPNLRELRLVDFGLMDNDVATLFHSRSNFSTSLTILDFSYNMLTSSSFQFMSNLSLYLQELHLSQNNIEFSSHFNPKIPPVVILDLSYNNLTSSQFIGNLNFSSKLQELYLTNCSLTDNSFRVPSTSIVKPLSSLIVLDLSLNILQSSKVFLWILNFTTNLHNLDLHKNLLEGNILAGFGKVMDSVERIDLSHNYLQGNIPSFFGNMCVLQELYLSNNNLSGEVSNFFQTSSRCKKHILWGVDLSYNQITGGLPKNINLLSNLDNLDLSGNSLEGEVNESHLNNFPKLRSLCLSYNSLSIRLPQSWIPPFQLTRLRLASCKLDSSFPSWLKTQKILMTLDISNVGINDYVPEWIWNNAQYMLMMNMSHNNLKGRIPHFPFELPQNPVIILNSNQLEGGIPSFLLQASHLMLSENQFSNLSTLLCDKISPVAKLSSLDLSNNQIKGQLPDCWKSVNTLMFLDLKNNKILGKIPQSMGSLVKLEALVLKNNSLNGELPSTLRNCSNLILLDVGENLLLGQIPSWIGKSMPHLIILSMKHNRFYGNIPFHLCYLRKIQLLDLSKNNLSGGLPSCINKFATLSEKITNSSEIESHIYSTQERNLLYFEVIFKNYVFYISLFWKGTERMFKAPELNLKSIDLSSNNLTGEIPKEIGHLIGLVSLNLSRNKLSGEIPYEIGDLISLDFLDLSRNHFSGNIPSSLSKIVRLEILDLSYNSLYGKIPFGRQLQTLDPSGFKGNLNLCGEPLEIKCPEDMTKVNSKGPEIHGEDENFIFQNGFCLSLGLGYFTGFWGLLGSILLWRPWRITYLRFLNKVRDDIYVLVAVKVAKFQRWIKG